MTYDEAKFRQLNAASTYRVYGHTHEFEQEEGETERTRIASRKRWRLISPCLCVWDSPDSPCPCDTEMLWWLSEDSVIAQGKSGRKDQHGKELQFFDVLVESKIMVESVRPISVGALKGLGNNVTPARVLDLTTEGREGRGSALPGTIQAIGVDDFLLAFGLALVAAAIVEGRGGAAELVEKVRKQLEDKHQKNPPK